MEDSKIIKANEKIISNTIDGEAVMMSPSKRVYIGLNKVGTYIWQLVQDETTYKNLKKNILNKYAISEEDCEEKIIKFISKLEKNDLVTLK